MKSIPADGAPIKKSSRRSTPRISVSGVNLKKAAARLLKTPLVSTEVLYLQRTLGATATQEDLDAKVVAVRSLPWSEIIEAEQ